jgi:RNA polymerase sigma-70 factor (ECF subfamily)
MASQPDNWTLLPEQELGRLYAGNDEDRARAALTELLRRHDDQLRAVAYHRVGRRFHLGGRHLAEDAFQETAVKLWRFREKYEPSRESWGPWAVTILKNVCRDLLRRPRIPSSAEVEDFPAPSPDPDRNDYAGFVDECLDGLDTYHRDLLRRRFVLGQTLEQIARDTGRPLASVHRHIQKALGWLRDCLESKIR